jgi:hypothetical protein
LQPATIRFRAKGALRRWSRSGFSGERLGGEKASAGSEAERGGSEAVKRNRL